jgi:hypothetical protein
MARKIVRPDSDGGAIKAGVLVDRGFERPVQFTSGSSSGCKKSNSKPFSLSKAELFRKERLGV